VLKVRGGKHEGKGESSTPAISPKKKTQHGRWVCPSQGMKGVSKVDANKSWGRNQVLEDPGKEGTVVQSTQKFSGWSEAA